MLLWQDQVSGAVNPPWTRLAPNPTDAKWTDEAHAQYMLELDRMGQQSGKFSVDRCLGSF